MSTHLNRNSSGKKQRNKKKVKKERKTKEERKKGKERKKRGASMWKTELSI